MHKVVVQCWCLTIYMYMKRFILLKFKCNGINCWVFEIKAMWVLNHDLLLLLAYVIVLLTIKLSLAMLDHYLIKKHYHPIHWFLFLLIHVILGLYFDLTPVSFVLGWTRGSVWLPPCYPCVSRNRRDLQGPQKEV